MALVAIGAAGLLLACVLFKSILPATLALSGAVGLLLLLIALRRLVLTSAALVLEPTPLPDQPDPWPRITVFVPAHNEAAVLGGCLEALARVDYPADRWEVVVIDDASTDDTADVARAYADRIPSLILFSRPSDRGGRGKPAALNEALAAYPDGEICFFLDADAQVAPDVLMRAAAHLDGEKIGAVTGRLEPRNPLDSPAAYYTAVEAWTHQLATLSPASRIGLTCAVLGSNWAIRRSVLDVYGLGDQELLEDTDLSVALAADGRPVVFDEGMVARYEVPPTLREYFRQHIGWARGFTRIGRRRAVGILSGTGNLVTKLDRFIYSWGYVDRPLLLLFLAMAAANWLHPLFFAPLWLFVLVVAMPLFQMLVGLVRARRPASELWRLIFLAPMAATDLAVALVALAQDLRGTPTRWYRTGRRGEGRPGAYLNEHEENHG